MTNRDEVLGWIRTQANEADLVYLGRWIALREAELTRIEPWAKQVVVEAAVRVKGAPAPNYLHGRVGRVVRETKNPMKVAVEIEGEMHVLHSAALEVVGDEG